MRSVREGRVIPDLTTGRDRRQRLVDLRPELRLHELGKTGDEELLARRGTWRSVDLQTTGVAANLQEHLGSCFQVAFPLLVVEKHSSSPWVEHRISVCVEPG
jgi:hypothetical protein